MREYELAEVVVEREPIDAAGFHRDDELRGRAVHREAGGHHFGAGETDVFLCAFGALGELEDGKDGADGDAGVEVRGAVDGVACYLKIPYTVSNDHLAKSISIRFQVTLLLA
jgi:hypothetical protein